MNNFLNLFLREFMLMLAAAVTKHICDTRGSNSFHGTQYPS